MDVRSAYDTISRAAVFNKLLEVAPALVPFTRAWYGAPSEFLWWDQHNVCHRIPQGEGLEQGDALAPALFALGQHDALAGAAEQLLPTECLAAYLDDLYVVTTPDRARLAYDTLTRAVAGHTGIAANAGKTRAYNHRGGDAPPGIADLGPAVLRGSHAPPEAGFLALGVPLGTAPFAQQHDQARLTDEHVFLNELMHPTAASPVRHLAFLPSRLGGLGLFSAEHLKKLPIGQPGRTLCQSSPNVAPQRPTIASHS